MYAAFQTHRESMAHEGMADIEGVEMGNGKKIRQIGEPKTVAGVDLKPELVGLPGGFFQANPFGAAARRVGVGKATSVQLNDRGMDGRGGRDLTGVRIDKEADENAGLAEFLNDGAEGLFLPGSVQSAFGRDLSPVFRNQADLGRLQAESELEHGGGSGHFEVEAIPKLPPDAEHVLVLDVAAILSQMDGQRVGAGGKADPGRQEGIRFRRRGGGMVSVTGLPQRGDMVNIHAQTDHRVRIPPFGG